LPLSGGIRPGSLGELSLQVDCFGATLPPHSPYVMHHAVFLLPSFEYIPWIGRKKKEMENGQNGLEQIVSNGNSHLGNTVW